MNTTRLFERGFARKALSLTLAITMVVSFVPVGQTRQAYASEQDYHAEFFDPEATQITESEYTITDSGTYQLAVGLETKITIAESASDVMIEGNGVVYNDDVEDINWSTIYSTANKVRIDATAVEGASLTIKNLYNRVSTATESSMIDFSGESNTLTFAGLNVIDLDVNANNDSLIHVGVDTSLSIVTEADSRTYLYKHSMGAGIGGERYEMNGDIHFSGDGQLYIKGSKQGAVIGSGAASKGSGEPGEITFEGNGVYYVIAVARGAAIGGSAGSGGASEGTKVTVSDNVQLYINQDYSGATIGGGGYDGGIDSSGGTLIYQGGTICPYIDKNAANNCEGWGGALMAEGVNQISITAQRVDGAGNTVYFATIPTDGDGSASHTVQVDGETVFEGMLYQNSFVYDGVDRAGADGKRDASINVYPNSTIGNWGPDVNQNLYLFLTGEDHQIIVDDVEYQAVFDAGKETDPAGAFTLERVYPTWDITTEVVASPAAQTGEAGTLTVAGQGMATTEIQVSATPSEGYYLDGLSYSYDDGSGQETCTIDVANDGKYDGKGGTYSFTMPNAATHVVATFKQGAPTVTGVSLASSPTKTAYVEGQEFDAQGMVISAEWSSGAVSQVTDYQVTPNRAIAADDTKVNISGSYEGVSYSFDIPITVEADYVEGIAVQAAPGKLVYASDENLDAKGLEVVAYYHRAPETAVILDTADYQVSLNRESEALDISYAYRGQTASTTQPITVLDTPAPTLKEGCYQLKCANDVLWFADLVNSGENSANAALRNDVDMSGLEFIVIGSSQDNAYTGTFDGGNHKLNVQINQPLGDAVAPFAHVGAGALIKNLVVTGSITGYSNVAGIAGIMYGGTLSNCGNQASLVELGAGNMGGVVAYLNPTQENAKVSGCYNTGSVTRSASEVASYYGVGGVVGFAQSFGTNSASIADCYNRGDISSTYTVGGVVGYAKGTDASAAVTISNCYNAGLVTDSSASSNGSCDGAVVGSTYTSNAHVRVYNSYFLQGTNQFAYGSNSNIGYCSITEKTALQMKAAEFPAVLGTSFTADPEGAESLNAGYPVLAWQLVSPIYDYTLGDVNDNGRLNIVDAQIVLDLACGCYGEDYSGLLEMLAEAGTQWNTATVQAAADMNGNGVVEALDARAIQVKVHEQ